jgi:hypothetical protein
VRSMTSTSIALYITTTIIIESISCRSARGDKTLPKMSFAAVRNSSLPLDDLDVPGLDSQQPMTSLLDQKDYNDFLYRLEPHQLPILLDLPLGDPKFDRIRTHTSYHQKQHRDFEEPGDSTDDDYERMEVSRPKLELLPG